MWCPGERCNVHSGDTAPGTVWLAANLARNPQGRAYRPPPISLDTGQRPPGADQGLLVCWGGFTNPTIKEARRSFFRARLWDSGDLPTAVVKNYDSFPDTLQAELPLKRLWGLVLEEE